MKKSENKILFVPFWMQCPQHKMAASARFRAEWPAKYLEADLCTELMAPQHLLNYDLVIFQKCYNEKFLNLARELKIRRKKVCFDICDAEWVQRETEVQKMIDMADFITCPTEMIRTKINSMSIKNCYVVPDGHDLKYYEPIQYAIIYIDEPLKMVWYGNSGTIVALNAINDILNKFCRKDDTLTIIADERARSQAVGLKIKHNFVKWELETANDEIRRHNLALNPKLDTFSYFKSNNKTATAYILGLPCIERWNTDIEGWQTDLERMRNTQVRMQDVQAKRGYYLNNFSMEKVAEIWREIIAKELKK